jgi:hypothetical protein
VKCARRETLQRMSARPRRLGHRLPPDAALGQHGQVTTGKWIRFNHEGAKSQKSTVENTKSPGKSSSFWSVFQMRGHLNVSCRNRTRAVIRKPMRQFPLDHIGRCAGRGFCTIMTTIAQIIIPAHFSYIQPDQRFELHKVLSFDQADTK